ncbi:MAG: hypothetical protein V1895_03515 [Parcubacteria group bacterium]
MLADSEEPIVDIPLVLETVDPVVVELAPAVVIRVDVGEVQVAVGIREVLRSEPSMTLPVDCSPD